MGARIISGETADVFVETAASTAVHVGDMTYLSANTALPALSASANNAAIATAQAALKAAFLGISKDQKAVTDTATSKICIATTGRYLVPCLDEAAKSVGTWYGGSPAADSNTTTLLSQLVQSVANNTVAIGRSTKLKAANATVVELEIKGLTQGAML
jgi:hypothetical protein